jgi:hypothetical protein
MSRRHVLGDLYSRCDAIVENIPVYREGDEGEVIGYVDQSLGHFADAFSFHLPDDVCKKLATGHFVYLFNYVHSDPAHTDSRSQVTLSSITLVGRKPYEKPLPKRRSAVEAEETIG